MKLCIILFLAISVIGCSTINTLDDTHKYSPDRVKSATYPFYYSQVFYAAEKACHDLGLKIYYIDKAEGRIVAKSPIRSVLKMIDDGTLSFGEKIAIYIYATTSKVTSVDVVVQKKDLAGLTYIDWRPKVLSAIRTNLFQHFKK